MGSGVDGEVRLSYLYLPSSEQRLIQSHGCPDRLFVCKLNVGKPGEKKKKGFGRHKGS